MYLMDLIGCLEPREHTNGSMVRHLRSTGALTTDAAAEAMLAVDRADYLGHADPQLNYSDMPIKLGVVHLSAPSIYASALEALQVVPGCSFLHVGSGTGYFSTIVAKLAGPHTVNHGVEQNGELIERARTLAARRTDAHNLEFFHANAMQLHIEPESCAAADGGQQPPAERRADDEDDDDACCMKYDRIYVAAAALPEHRRFFKLLRQGGVLVGPFEAVARDGRLAGHQSLVRVVRTGADTFVETRLQPVQFAPLRQPSSAELAAMPRLALAPLVWCPHRHGRFPPKFRAAVRHLLWLASVDACHLSRLPRELLLRTIAQIPFYAFEAAPAHGGGPSTSALHAHAVHLVAHGRADGGRHDGGRHDGGRHDGGRHDGGRHDGGRHDGGRHDGGGEEVKSDEDEEDDEYDADDGAAEHTSDMSADEEGEGGLSEGAIVADAAPVSGDELAAQSADRFSRGGDEGDGASDGEASGEENEQTQPQQLVEQRARPMDAADSDLVDVIDAPPGTPAAPSDDGSGSGSGAMAPCEDTPPSVPQPAPKPSPLWAALGRTLSRRAVSFEL
ncbi:hypothetical protein KFE25_000624 [Diacronema lutheri]|uniref:Protein-L-isoaspartate O-methyltransferase n=2 Tax=Diacronema lutheri TaxID=2081491 RepID=A0A8J5XLX8_DIALT|nr:hypothetical protein KFE25_000624 [Diacronema lutheri]